MKRRDFLRHLAAHGCQLLREGGRHSIFFNPQTGATSIFLPEKFAETWEFPNLIDLRTYFNKYSRKNSTVA